MEVGVEKAGHKSKQLNKIRVVLGAEVGRGKALHFRDVGL